jgi:hypothetical protein
MYFISQMVYLIFGGVKINNNSVLPLLLCTLESVLPDLGKFPNFGEILGKGGEIFYLFGKFPKWEKFGEI